MTVRVITFDGALQWALAPCIDQFCHDVTDVRSVLLNAGLPESASEEVAKGGLGGARTLAIP